MISLTFCKHLQIVPSRYPESLQIGQEYFGSSRDLSNFNLFNTASAFIFKNAILFLNSLILLPTLIYTTFLQVTDKRVVRIYRKSIIFYIFTNIYWSNYTI